jgi:probable blue pigment (indigoidine) exporter
VNHRLRAAGLFLLVTVVFGTAFPAVKTGLSFLPPLLFAAARSYVVVTTAHWRPRSRADWVAVSAGGLFLVGGTGPGFVGQQFITAGVAAIIFSLSPIVTVLLAWALLPEERLEGRDYVGILLGFVGIAVVVRPDPSGLLDAAVVGRLVFLAGVIVALGTVLIRRSGSTMPAPALTGWAMLIGGTVHVGFAVAVGESVASVQTTPLAAAMVVYLGVVVGAVGLVVYLTLLGTVGAVKASLTTYLTPVVALGLGWLLLDEQIQVAALVGFGIVVVGFSLLERRGIAAELARYRGLFR